MSIFREHGFLKPEEVTIDKIFEICQNAYLKILGADKDAVFIEEDGIRMQIFKRDDEGVQILSWTSFDILEKSKQESLNLAKETCYHIHKKWRMLRVAPEIDEEKLIMLASYEIYCDRGLFIPQLVSDIKRFCDIVRSAQEDSYYKLLEDINYLKN